MNYNFPGPERQKMRSKYAKSKIVIQALEDVEKMEQQLCQAYVLCEEALVWRTLWKELKERLTKGVYREQHVDPPSAHYKKLLLDEMKSMERISVKNAQPDGKS